MAIRRLNFTDRQRVLREDIRITFYPPDDGPAAFDAELDLSGYGLPIDSAVVVEAYRQTTRMRFDFGTVGNIRPPAVRKLTEFAPTDKILFRVKTVGSGEHHGLLLAVADHVSGLTPGDKPGNRIPLLPVEAADLGNLAWRIDFGADDEPTLQINTEYGDWRAAARSPQFMALVYPAALEQILAKVFLIEEYYSADDNSDWQALWLRFASTLPGVDGLPDQDDSESDKMSWIQDAVMGFCRAHRFRQYFATAGTGGSAS